MTVALETIGVILYSKTEPEVPTGNRGFTRVCARLQGQDRPPLWSPYVAAMDRVCVAQLVRPWV